MAWHLCRLHLSKHQVQTSRGNCPTPTYHPSVSRITWKWPTPRPLVPSEAKLKRSWAPLTQLHCLEGTYMNYQEKRQDLGFVPEKGIATIEPSDGLDEPTVCLDSDSSRNVSTGPCQTVRV